MKPCTLLVNILVSFIKNGNRRNRYTDLGYLDTLFVKGHSEVHTKHFKVDVSKMLEFLIDNIYVEYSGHFFSQTVVIQMGTNCSPLLADLILYEYES